MLVTYRRLPVVEPGDDGPQDMSQPTGPMEEHTVRIDWTEPKQDLESAIACIEGNSWSGEGTVGQAFQLDSVAECYFLASVTISRKESPLVYVADNPYGHGVAVAYIYYEQTNESGIPQLAEQSDIDEHPAMHLTTRVLYGFESVSDACDHIREAWNFWDDYMLNPVSATVFSELGNQAPIF